LIKINGSLIQFEAMMYDAHFLIIHVVVIDSDHMSHDVRVFLGTVEAKLIGRECKGV